MVLQPRVASSRVAFHGLGHALRVGGNRPAAHWNPGPMLLPEELVHRHTGGLTHQVVHRRAQGQGQLVAHPVEWVRAEVALDNVLRNSSAAVAEAGEAGVGVGDVDRAPGRTAVVIERISEPVLVWQADLVELDFSDLHGSIVL